VGYQTHLFGLQHEHWNPQALGYSHVHPVKSTYSEDVTPAFANWLQSRGEAGEPFLANVGLFEPHRIGLASQGYDEALFGTLPSHFKRDVYDSVNPAQVQIRPYLLDLPVVRQEVADFYGAVRFMDHHVGKVLQALDDAGLTGSTLVIFATDHGASFMHSKGTLYDGGTKVAFLMRWPGNLPADHRVKALTSHVDVVPTLLDLLDLPSPNHIQGQSFAGIVQGATGMEREYVYAQKNYTQYYDPARMIRSDSFKYIRKGLNTCLFDFVLTEIELSPTSFRSNRTVSEFYSARRSTEELYDLNADSAEMNNLVDNPAYEIILNKMRAALDTHLEMTDDPFRYLENDLLMPTNVYTAITNQQNNDKPH
jgi:arylsulfatase A-like enzyme